jgi:hypothetical protein
MGIFTKSEEFEENKCVLVLLQASYESLYFSEQGRKTQGDYKL